MSEVKNKYRGSREYFLVFSELLKAAAHRGTVTYQELAAVVGLPPQGSHMAAEIGHLLGEISEDEVARQRPMLSALAVKSTGEPGLGFFELASRLRRLTDESPEARHAYWTRCCRELYECWSPHPERRGRYHG